jgi:urea transport system permease protein
MRRVFGLLIIALLVLAPASGRADDADDAFIALASGNFNTIRHGVELLAFSGHPQALAVLSALQASRLYVRADHALFIKTDAGGFLDATTGKPAPDVMASGVKPVRMNNPVRGEVEAALGSLQLLLGDSNARFAAAEAVFHSHDPAALPALTKAIAKETDPAVKQRMEQARAAALLFSDNATEQDRVAAVATIRARGDLDSRALLDSLTNQPPAVTMAARTAITAIDRVLQLWSIAQSVY